MGPNRKNYVNQGLRQKIAKNCRSLLQNNYQIVKTFVVSVMVLATSIATITTDTTTTTIIATNLKSCEPCHQRLASSFRPAAFHVLFH